MAGRLILGLGYIGSAFVAAGENGRKADYRVGSRADYAIRRYIDRTLREVEPTAVINCAGFTGRPHIDQCEVERDETILANVWLPAMLSRACADFGVPFVHISSGCIFQGSGDYDENAKPASELSFYSQSKLLAEQVVHGYVLRIRMPFDGSGHERCLLTKLAKYPRLISEENSITYVPDLIAATEALLTAQAPYGVYHVTNSGVVTHRQIAELMGWHKEFIPVSKLDVKAPRSNCTLSNDKLSAYYRMPDVRERLLGVCERKAA